MQIKEQIKAEKAQLLALKDAIAAGDDAAIEEAEGLKASIEKLEAKAAKIDAAQKMLDGIGTTDDGNGQAEPKSFGEFCAKGLDGVDASEKFTKSVDVKSVGVISGAPVLTQYDTNPVNITKPLTIADLFGSETISGNSLTYYVVSDKEGAAGVTAEGAKKNQLDFSYTPKTVALTKVTGYIVETDEIMEDAPWLASAIQDRLLNKLGLAEESELISGSGSGAHMTGLLNVAGLGAATYANGGKLGADDIFAAIMKVKTDSNMDADAIVINPVDYQRLRLAKDANNQYYGGGYFYGEYGNGSASQVPPLWGLKTVLSTAVTAGTCIVGAFKQGGSIVSKSGLTVQATNTNGEDFVYNRVTIRAEKRETLAVRVPAAFVAITEATA